MSDMNAVDEMVRLWRLGEPSFAPPKNVFRRVAALLSTRPIAWVSGDIDVSGRGKTGSLTVFSDRILVHAKFTHAFEPHTFGGAEPLGDVHVRVLSRSRVSSLEMRQRDSGENSAVVWGEDQVEAGWPRGASVIARYGSALEVRVASGWESRPSEMAMFVASLVDDLAKASN